MSVFLDCLIGALRETIRQKALEIVRYLISHRRAPRVTSAAESGHAMLRRIRKSLSYMSEGNANLFLWVAIQALKRRKLEILESETVQGEK
ncbi:hypothetical protein IAS59_003052 [Cryptococcus gattii]